MKESKVLSGKHYMTHLIVMAWLFGLTGKSSTRYAQIDITATETAHKVGTQHALGRQEGLHTLELRRKGTPH